MPAGVLLVPPVLPSSMGRGVCTGGPICSCVQIRASAVPRCESLGVRHSHVRMRCASRGFGDAVVPDFDLGSSRAHVGAAIRSRVAQFRVRPGSLGSSEMITSGETGLLFEKALL